MAIDLTDKRRNLASNMMQQSVILIDALNALLDLAVEKEALTSGFVDADFEGTSLKHLNASKVDGMVSSARAINTWMDDNGGATSDFARNRLIEVRP